jgi:hypothetical protein
VVWFVLALYVGLFDLYKTNCILLVLCIVLVEPIATSPTMPFLENMQVRVLTLGAPSTKLLHKRREKL